MFQAPQILGNLSGKECFGHHAAHTVHLTHELTEHFTLLQSVTTVVVYRAALVTKSQPKHRSTKHDSTRVSVRMLGGTWN